MKKLLIILITIPLIFGSCEKEEEDNNNNNNSSLSLEQTKWSVESVLFEDNISGDSFLFDLPLTEDEGWDGGINEIEWTFYNNNDFLIEKYTDDDNVIFFDTLIYSYYSNLNTILLTEPNGGEVSIIYNEFYPTGNGIDIIQFNSNNLSLEVHETLGGDNYTYTFNLNRVL